MVRVVLAEILGPPNVPTGSRVSASRQGEMGMNVNGACAHATKGSVRIQNAKTRITKRRMVRAPSVSGTSPLSGTCSGGEIRYQQEYKGSPTSSQENYFWILTVFVASTYCSGALT